MEERGTIFLWRLSICPKPRRTPKVNRLPRTLKPNKLTFLKSPKSSAHASGAWHHSNPAVTFSIRDFHFDISEWHILPARAWTPALILHLTNPCANRKVLSLTKPKGKLYKTESLSHYITMLHWIFWNRTVLSFNCVCTNEWCLIQLLVIRSSILNRFEICKILLKKKFLDYLIVCKQTTDV